MTDNDQAIELLETRLHRGWELIDQAERAADERAVSRYTQRWLQLLDEYERVVRPRTPEDAGARTE
jgi:hypothetical protein